eukprot:CAMPEP_0170163570 /NCGR_PEP_ID=MMETSP0033_2-20121228/77668_1 /TAXON_ID=195969 /ORGANISM="Dolichomastix tenuilepis, Strain CCMP3274" /LENGTH=103 /DNA_ID=CAMNT_0010401209 /DNA_START=485 /DNA_END=796 /DNA_ORIENTATION=+
MPSRPPPDRRSRVCGSQHGIVRKYQLNICRQCFREYAKDIGSIRLRTMGFANIWNTHPKEHSKGGRNCRVCGSQHGIVRKYQLNICRQCFREYAKDIGFVKLR